MCSNKKILRKSGISLYIIYFILYSSPVIFVYRHIGVNTNAGVTSHRITSSSNKKPCICISQRLTIPINKISNSREHDMLQLHSEMRPRDVTSRISQVMEIEKRSRATRSSWEEFNASSKLFNNGRLSSRYYTYLNFHRVTRMGYSPIEPAMSLFPPRARILVQFRQSEPKSHETERRTGAEGEREGKADHHLVISQRFPVGQIIGMDPPSRLVTPLSYASSRDKS